MPTVYHRKKIRKPKSQRLTVKEVAKKLNLTWQYIGQKVTRGDFPSAEFCECGRTIFIDKQDLLLSCNQRKVPKKNE
jgi:hypothetical protein